MEGWAGVYASADSPSGADATRPRDAIGGLSWKMKEAARP